MHATSASHPPSMLDRASRILSDVRSGEGTTALLFASSLFVGLFAYYVLKTVREPLILVTGGAEARSYATAMQALVLMVLVPLYARLAQRFDRKKLVLVTQVGFIVSIELFAVLSAFRVPFLGIAFYVWLGVYALTSVAQLWSLANDVYAHHEGMRLFPVVALGAPLGSAAGALFASHAFAGHDSIAVLIHASVALLLVQLGILTVLLRRPEVRTPMPPLERTGGFTLVWRSSHLRWVAILVVLLNLVNTTGEYLLSRAFLDEAAHAASLAQATDVSAFTRDFVRASYGQFYFVVNAGSVLLQALIASRVASRFGLRGVLLALPIVALGAYGALATGVSFLVFRAMKIAENATDYSLQNTGKALIWLGASRDEKYKAKQVIDAYFMRFGDVLSALLVFGATHLVELTPRALAMVNVVFTLLALAVSLRVSRSAEARVQPTSG